MGDGILRTLVSCLALFLIFLPVIIAESRSRKVLVVAALILSLLAMGVAIASSVLIGTIGMIGLPLAGFLWISGLLCALAAWMNEQQEKRFRQTVLRLLSNDGRGLGEIEH